MALSITSRVELEDWLQDKPVEWAQVIAARCALRLFPLVFDLGRPEYQAISQQYLARLFIYIFRANLITWVAHVNSNGDFRAPAYSVAVNAEPHITENPLYSASMFAANSIAAANSAASKKAPVIASFSAVESAFYSVNPDEKTSFWNVVSEDCIWLESTNEPLILQPLWFNGLPKEIANALEHFERATYSQEWEVWGLVFQWYRYLAPIDENKEPASYFGNLIDTHIASQSEEFWTITEDRSAEQILREIGAFVDRNAQSGGDQEDEVNLRNSGDLAELEADIETALENIEPQVPAAYQFGIRDGKITALSQRDMATDPRGAQTVLDEARHKAALLKERLHRSNAEQRVKASVEGLLDALPEQISDLDEYRLRSRFRSIEADALAYVNDEAELFPDAVAALVDLSETVKDLQSFYPALRNMEAEVLLFDIPPNRIDETLDRADEIAAAVDEFPELADASTPEALQESGAIPREEAATDVRQKRTAEYLLVIRNFLSVVARALLDNAFTREARRIGTNAYDKARPVLLKGISDGVDYIKRPDNLSQLAHRLIVLADPLSKMAMGIKKIAIQFKIEFNYEWKPSSKNKPSDSKEEDHGVEDSDSDDSESSED